MTCCVYILQSQVNHSFYKGSTRDLIARFNRHNARLDSYTKKYAPWNLIWFTIKSSKAEAVQLERKLKNLSTTRLIEFMIKYPSPAHFDNLPVSPIAKYFSAQS